MRPTVEAVIMAGSSERSRKIYGKNKALLQLFGVPLLVYVLDALLRSQYVETITVVGPVEIKKILKREYPKEVRILKDRGSLVENGLLAISEIYKSRGKDKDKAILFVPSDIPLLTNLEVDQFIKGCEIDSYDYFIGLTPKEVLANYYPTKWSPGIKMAYFHLKEGEFRINNLHLIKPSKVEKSKLFYFDKVYAHRYQKDFKNIWKFGSYFAKNFMFLPLLYYMLLHISHIFSTLKLRSLAKLCSQFCSIKRGEMYISNILGLKVKTVITTFGGAALDIDSEKDFEVFRQMFARWKVMQLELPKDLKLYPI